MDSDHGVLPLPVATWFLPVNPLIYTPISVCLVACILLSGIYFSFLLFIRPSFLSSFLSIFLSFLVHVCFDIDGTFDQYFSCIKNN